MNIMWTQRNVFCEFNNMLRHKSKQETWEKSTDWLVRRSHWWNACWLIFCIPVAAGAATGQMQAYLAAASNSCVSPWWTDMCIRAFYRLSRPNCDNSISSCSRQVALMMITAFHLYVVLYMLGSCDTWHHIHSCTELAYLDRSVVRQTCALELR